ncbi:MAG: hypothetical protein R3Y26_05270 [Rikenellaceae bacterium]
MKKYKSLNSKYLSTYVEVDGAKRNVIFQNWYFQTDNTKLQEALEKDSSFGKTYVCEDVINLAVKPKVEGEELELLEDVVSKQLAVEWLKAKGETLALNTSVAKLKEKAKGYGYVFNF